MAHPYLHHLPPFLPWYMGLRPGSLGMVEARHRHKKVLKPEWGDVHHPHISICHPYTRLEYNVTNLQLIIVLVKMLITNTLLLMPTGDSQLTTLDGKQKHGTLSNIKACCFINHNIIREN